MKLYFTLDLKNDPELIRQYEFWHRPENIWKEIPQGIKASGIRGMEIYLHENRLIMIIDIPDELDPDAVMNQLGKLPLQAEWEKFMNKFQQVIDESKAGGKWKPMKKIFSLTECTSLKIFS